jgi:hypothetical protein
VVGADDVLAAGFESPPLDDEPLLLAEPFVEAAAPELFVLDDDESDDLDSVESAVDAFELVLLL